MLLCVEGQGLSVIVQLETDCCYVLVGIDGTKLVRFFCSFIQFSVFVVCVVAGKVTRVMS